VEVPEKPEHKALGDTNQNKEKQVAIITVHGSRPYSFFGVRRAVEGRAAAKSAWTSEETGAGKSGVVEL
jgi:hypothetical protein